ncbi:hypothetical protein [Aquimarina agarivorans]|uniref:hypothetical protein n=1 Tax=Aquimarina agarivorans TaxID=980584 RepID=UPI0003060158|nr:hypothetical protein [Aquimarina agarivorans]
MAKSGSSKNTKNKALHSKLMERKKNKARKEKDKNKALKKDMARKFQEQLKVKQQ